VGDSLLGLLLWSASPSQAQECPDRLARLDLLDEAERALVEADLDTTDLKLRELEAALACGPLAEGELLGRLWLVEAAWLTMQGDALAAGDSWRAAARVAPGRWVENFGKQLRESYEAATAETPVGTATLSLDPPLFRWVGSVDGRVVEFPAQVPPGLHLVQVGSDESHVVFARMVVAYPSTPIVVQTGLVEPTTAFVGDPAEPGEPPREEKLPKEPLPAPTSSLFVAGGANLAIGKPVGEGEGAEPGVKVVLPIETGLTLRPGRAWIRWVGLAGPLVGGNFRYTDKFGETSTPVALGTLLAAGASAGQGDMGLMAGFQWPDRVPVRGVVAGRLPRFPGQFEGRLGMNAAFGRTPEVAFDVVFALTPALIR
jgi:hypothetical protein